MQDGTSVGLYAAAYKLAFIPTRFSAAFHRAVYPVLSRHAAASDRKLFAKTSERSMRFLMLGGVPLAIGTTILAEPIMHTIFGQSYIAGAVALRMLTWAFVLEFFNPFFSLMLFAMERQRLVLVIETLGTGLNIVLNIVLIPRYGFIGAAIAILLSAGLIRHSVLFGSSICVKSLIGRLDAQAIIGRPDHVAGLWATRKHAAYSTGYPRPIRLLWMFSANQGILSRRNSCCSAVQCRLDGGQGGGG